MSNLSITRLAEKAASLEQSRKRATLAAKSQKMQFVGALSALAGAGGAGYLDGRLDVMGLDEIAGDGIRIAGIPAMAVASGALVVGGLYMGGTMGHAVSNVGVGVGCGVIYTKMRAQGVEAAAKK
jgi:hypothetical protein